MSARLLGVLLAIPLLASVSFAQSPPVSLCFEDADNFPWHVKGGHGLSNQLLDMAAARSGVKIEQTGLPWKRCLLDVASGHQAGAFGASFTEERAAFGVYPTTADGKPDPLRRLKTDSYSLYRLKGTPANWDGKQFSNLSGPVGAQLGYSVATDLRKMGIPVDEGSANTAQNMRKLIAGRIQLLALQTQEGDVTLANPEFAGKIEKISPPFSEKSFYVLFGKDYYSQHKKSVDALWAGLARARESNEFKALRQEKMKPFGTAVQTPAPP